MDLQQEIQRMLRIPALRSADRANLQRYLKQLRGGRSLSTEQRENLWAYRTRYSQMSGR